MALIRRGSTATGRLIWGQAQTIALTPIAVAGDVPVIGRPLWFGWFEFTPAMLPGNCELMQVSSWEWRLQSQGQKVAVYVSGEPDGSLSSLNANIAKVKSQGVPVIGYWPRSLQTGPLPTGADWIGLEAYRLKSDTLAVWEAGVRKALARCPKAALIAQCYTSNTTLTTDLRSLVPVYGQIAKDTAKVVAVIPFSGSGRPTGLQDHPDVLPLWQQFAAGIPSAPPIPPKPEPPKPEPPKPEPPKPMPTTLTLYANTGQYVCAEPDGRLVANRDAAGAWETFSIERLHSGLIALRTAHGKYVCAEGGGGGVLIADRGVAGAWESFRQHQVGQGVALETSNGHYWCAEGGGGGEVNATRLAIGAWETFNAQASIPNPTPPGPVPGLRGQLSAKGETLVDAAGLRFDWLGATAFRLVELVATGKEAEARAWLAWASGVGFTVQRILTMCAAAPDGGMFRLHPADGLAALPATLKLCAEYGQYVEVVALAATERFGFDEAACRKHVRQVSAVCSAFNHTTLQIANEYQDGSHCKWLEDDIAHVHALSSEIGNGVLYTESPPNGEDDEHEFPKGLYLTRHRARKDKWNNARRIIELERLAGKVHLPMVDDEPSGAAEKPRGNSRFDDPAFFYAQGLLTAFHNIAGTTFHSEDGLYARVPGPVQRSCAQALMEGFRFPSARGYRFENAKHSTSPVKDADFNKVCRVFSFLHPSGSWTVALGVTGDPKIQWQNGYRPVEVQMPYGTELHVIRIAK